MNVMRSRDAVLMLAVVLFTGGCAGGSDETAGGEAGAPAAESAAGGGSPTPSADFTEADLDALARGLARETELVREAQSRAATAATPEARAEAARAQWEDQT
ncbi:MAG: hypothetical protein M3Y31_01980, partial [Gemmatimonadota bacterium]|nr:hypothetical protein [Gemmatimonadota bacterium]